MGKLTIKGLTLPCCVGVYAWEQKIKQKLVFDICIPYNFILLPDEIQEALDYERICAAVEDYLHTKSFNLIETVAREVAAMLKQTFALPSLELTVSKPHAIRKATNIAVTIS